MSPTSGSDEYDAVGKAPANLRDIHEARVSGKESQSGLKTARDIQ